MSAVLFGKVVTELVGARTAVRALRLWAWDAEDAQAIGASIQAAMAELRSDPALWRIDLIAKPYAGAEIARLGCLDAAFCGTHLSAMDEKARARLIDQLSRFIATDGYLHVEGLGDRLHDRFVRDLDAPDFYRPVALTMDLSFL